MDVLAELGDAISMAATMGWEILWPLVLGFFLSGVVQAVVPPRAGDPVPCR